MLRGAENGGVPTSSLSEAAFKTSIAMWIGVRPPHSDPFQPCNSLFVSEQIALALLWLWSARTVCLAMS